MADFLSSITSKEFEVEVADLIKGQEALKAEGMAVAMDRSAYKAALWAEEGAKKAVATSPTNEDLDAPLMDTGAAVWKSLE